MLKNFMQKLLIVLLLISTLLVTFSSYNITLATDELSNNDSIYVFDESIDESELIEAQSLEDEKILMYDAKTGETTEIDMDVVRENITSSYSRSTNQTTPTYTNSYDPYAFSSSSEDLISTFSIYNEVTSYSTFPYRVTCRLIYDVYGRTGISTGFLVGPNLLLTAAHCVMNMDDNDATFADWTAYPGYNNGSSYGGYKCGWSEIIFPSAWKGNHNVADDWCLVVLNEPLGSYCGYLGCKSYGNGNQMLNLMVRTVGYAYSEGKGMKQYYTNGMIMEVYDGYILSGAMSTGGMSGGPTYGWGTEEVVAINRGHTDDYGVGVRINKTIVDLINGRS